MHKDQIIDGEIYWTCLQSDETNNYGDEGPHIPYQAKAKRVNIRPGVINLYLCRFRSETGEIDEDSNARAYISFQGNSTETNKVFKTYEEAATYYNLSVTAYANELRADADRLMNTIIPL